MSNSSSDDDISLFGPPKRQRAGRVLCIHCGETHFSTVPCANAPAYRPGLALARQVEDGAITATPAAPATQPAPPPFEPSLFTNRPRAVMPRVRVTTTPAPASDEVSSEEEVDVNIVEFDETIDGDLEDPVGGDDQPDEPAGGDGLVWRPYTILPNPIQRNLLDPQGHLNMYPKPAFLLPPGGARNIPDRVETPLHYFKLIFDSNEAGDGIADTFVKVMNVYGQSYYANRQRFQQLTLAEFYKFLALIMYGGLIKVPQFRLLWSRVAPYAMLYGRDMIKAVMSAHRFRQLWRCFHYVDATQLTPEQRTAWNRRDGFWSVTDYLAHLSKRWKYYYQPGQYVDVDEMCIFFKGRHRCRVYNPKKPNRFHLKAFCFNDAVTGYTEEGNMYRGREEERPPDVSATTYPVLLLTENEELHFKNYIMGLDNWYTSIPLILALLARGIHCVGTIKANRAGLPAGCKFSTARNAQPRGEMRAMKADLPDGKALYFIAWQDNKPVHMLSTFAPVAAVTHRRGRVNGTFQRVELPMPSTIAVYNSAMGGTDLCDQYTSYYDFEHRTNKWHRRIFTHFMTVSLRNAHVLFQTDPKNAHRPTTRSFRVFIETIISEIIGIRLPGFDVDVDSDYDPHDSGEDDDDSSSDEDDSDDDDDLGDVTAGSSDFAPLAEARSPPPVTTRRWWNGPQGRIRRMTGRDHWPIYLQKQVLTAVEGNGPPRRVDSRGRCYVCTKKTASSCASCGVSLCVYGDTQLENCFYRFHCLDEFDHDITEL